MQLRTLFIILFLPLLIPGIAQNAFKDGFIVTNDMDTIYGQVEFRTDLSKYGSCLFKESQTDAEYTPDKIIGYGYLDGAYFSSDIIDNLFVEVLVIGELSLFKAKDKFHLKKDDQVYDLESQLEKVERNGKVGYVEKSKWRGIVSYLTNDCPSYSTDIKKLELEERRLTKYISGYNKCKGVDYTELKSEQPFVKFELGLIAGLSNSQIKKLVMILIF